LHAAALAFSEPGESIIVQPPVYFPFFSAVTATGRNLAQNPLYSDSGRYAIDFDHLEQCAAGARMLMLCSPHNPVGRVWSKSELERILYIAKKYNLVVFSDEIHADLIYAESEHHILATLAEDPTNIITAVAPSKTFNIPGLNLSALIVPDKNRRISITRAFEFLHVSASNPFSIVAFEAAYREGASWLTDLLAYLQGTRDLVEKYLATHLPKIQVTKPEGTYLLWLDCRKFGMSDAQLKHFFVHEAGVGMSPGTLFGEGGKGFMRMNIGTQRHIITTALENIRRASL
jgi:cystathionine beta-lyase